MISPEGGENVAERAVTFSTQTEKEALWKVISSSLMTTGMRDVVHIENIREENRESVREQNSILRDKAEQLARDLGKTIDPESAVYYGLTSFVPHEQLVTWADPKSVEHQGQEEFQKYASFLLNEKQSSPQEK